MVPGSTDLYHISVIYNPHCSTRCLFSGGEVPCGRHKHVGVNCVRGAFDDVLAQRNQHVKALPLIENCSYSETYITTPLWLGEEMAHISLTQAVITCIHHVVVENRIMIPRYQTFAGLPELCILSALFVTIDQPSCVVVARRVPQRSDF